MFLNYHIERTVSFRIDKKIPKNLALRVLKALEVRGEVRWMDGGLQASVVWLLRQVAGQQFCVCSICMQVRSIIPVVETLSGTVLCHGLILGR